LGLGFLIPVSASAALEHPFIEDFGGVEQPSFTEAQGLAVDQSTGDLLVIDAGEREAGEGTLSRFHADGTPSDFSALGDNTIESLSFRFPEAGQVAVDNSGEATDGNIYVASQQDAGVVRIFDEDGNSLASLTGYKAGPNAEGAETPLGSFICGVAVDPDGNVYVGEFSGGGTIHKYEPTASSPVNSDNVANFAYAEACTLAAGAGLTDGFVFPAHLNTQGEAVAKLNSTTGISQYNAHPGPTTTVTVDPATGTLFAASGSEVKEYDASGAAEAIAGVPIAPPGGKLVQGIAVDETTGRIYVSREDNPNVEVWGEAVELPLTITEFASVIGDTATMRGVVNANNGPPTTCVFEYVEVSAKGFEGASTAPCSPAGPFTGNTSESVSAQVSGLAEGTYRFRLVASNEDGSKAGETLFFSTIGQLGLPDGRAYEMVTPPEKGGEVIPPEPVGQLGGSCGDCLPGSNDPSMPMQTVPDGSSVLYLGQPFTSGLASGPNEYVAPRSSSGWGTQSLSSPTTIGQFLAFSEDLSRAVLTQANPPLTPQAPTRGGNAFPNLYLVQGGAFEPLITGEPPNREPGDFEVSFAGANAGTAFAPAFGHVAFEANDALTAAAPAVGVGKACALPGADCNLYEWVGGELSLINVLPDENAAANAVIGSGRMLVRGIPTRQLPPNVSHAISDDGSRIFWSSEETGHVYVRVDGEETLEIPGPASCKESEPVKDRACFLTASPDGSTVLLADGSVYELNEAGTAYELSIDLTEGEEGFEGILGASEDLSRIYFVDTAALTGGEENDNGEEAEEGELNLYAFDEGELTFVGMLLSGDNEFGTREYGAWAASSSARTAQVSPDGAHLAFMSLASLTGYDNTRRGGGNCGGSSSPTCREVFVYSADTGTLSCASCNPTGQQPLGDSNLTLIRPDAPFRQPQNLSPDGSGRLFFESLDALSPRDANGTIQDVYEWEPNGVGSCNRAGGCVYLISSGQSPNDSMFMDSSDSGDDAFFITRERLLPLRDKNQQLDLYDARVGGGFEESAPGPCNPETCAGPLGSVPVQPSAGSGSFSGPGNPKPKHCKPGFVKKNGKCVKKHKKKKQGGKKRRGSR
jgi:hypothetical protein